MGTRRTNQTSSDLPTIPPSIKDVLQVNRLDSPTPKNFIAIDPCVYSGNCLSEVHGRILNKFNYDFPTSKVRVLPSPVA